MHRNFSFPLLHCYSAMDVLQMQMQHCNNYQNNQDLSLPSGSDILPNFWSCRASAIYDLPINLRYIHKRVPALVHMVPQPTPCRSEAFWEIRIADQQPGRAMVLIGNDLFLSKLTLMFDKARSKGNVMCFWFFFAQIIHLIKATCRRVEVFCIFALNIS